MAEHNGRFVLAYVTGLMGLGVVAIVMIVGLLPDEDSTALIGLVTGFVALGIGNILTYAKSHETHKTVNSRMDEFKLSLEKTAREAARLAYAEGEAAGRVQGKEAADLRTDEIAQHERKSAGQSLENIEVHTK